MNQANLVGMLRLEVAGGHVYSTLTPRERAAYALANPQSVHVAANTHGHTSRDLHDLAIEYGIKSPGMQPGSQSQQWIDRVLNVHAQAQRTGHVDPHLVRDANRLMGVAACWDGYEQVGLKTKNGKKVPNCVPKRNGKPKPQKKRK